MLDIAIYWVGLFTLFCAVMAVVTGEVTGMELLW